LAGPTLKAIFFAVSSVMGGLNVTVALHAPPGRETLILKSFDLPPPTEKKMRWFVFSNILSTWSIFCVDALIGDMPNVLEATPA
jgi:hypothetical protein